MKKSVIINAAQIATPIGVKAVCGTDMNNIRIIENGAIYIEDGIIKAVGKTEAIIPMLADLSDITVIDAHGKAVIPGFVDSHTHFVFGGYRENEFISRLEGAQYLEILKKGGGIQSTVSSTRNESYAGLLESGLKRLDIMLSQGITSIEGKSGYGLDLECEIKQLKVMKELDAMHDIDIVRTYLGAHALSPEYTDNEKYIDFMINDVLPAVKNNDLAEFCDVFCEQSVFSVEESRRLLEAAGRMGFKLKLHADEIVQTGASELAGELKAVSADHLLMISDKGIDSLRENEVIAALLPCTAFCLAKPYAPARKLVDLGCAVALASDLNPGSCFSGSIPLMLSLAVIYMKLTINEALTAVTLNGAAAIGRAEEIGSIETGKKADLVILDYPSYKFLVYNTGANIVNKVIKCGEVVYENTNYK